MKDIIARLSKLDKDQITPDQHMEANALIGDLMEHFGAKDIQEPEVEGEVD